MFVGPELGTSSMTVLLMRRARARCAVSHHINNMTVRTREPPRRTAAPGLLGKQQCGHVTVLLSVETHTAAPPRRSGVSPRSSGLPARPSPPGWRRTSWAARSRTSAGSAWLLVQRLEARERLLAWSGSPSNELSGDAFRTIGRPSFRLTQR